MNKNPKRIAVADWRFRWWYLFMFIIAMAATFAGYIRIVDRKLAFAILGCVNIIALALMGFWCAWLLRVRKQVIRADGYLCPVCCYVLVPSAAYCSECGYKMSADCARSLWSSWLDSPRWPGFLRRTLPGEPTVAQKLSISPAARLMGALLGVAMFIGAMRQDDQRIALIGATAGATVLLAAVFGVRLTRRPVSPVRRQVFCEFCRYPLSDQPFLHCPDCGTVVKIRAGAQVQAERGSE